MEKISSTQHMASKSIYIEAKHLSGIDRSIFIVREHAKAGLVPPLKHQMLVTSYRASQKPKAPYVGNNIFSNVTRKQALITVTVMAAVGLLVYVGHKIWVKKKASDKNLT